MQPASPIAKILAADRINVVGCSGSGKTTFARKLADLKACPAIEMDQLYWKPDWQEPTNEEFFPKVAAAVAAPRWVMDGNYSRTRHIKWPRTQLVIIIQLGFVQTVWSVLRRAVERIRSGQELWPGTGNRETWRNVFFARDSIVLFAAKSYASNYVRHRDPAFFEGYGDFDIVRVNSRREANQCLTEIADRPQAE